MIKVVGIGNPVMDFLIHTRKIPKTNESCRLEEYSWQGVERSHLLWWPVGRLGVKTGMVGS